ncbi:MAG: hypothetical protein GYB31_19080 [Bacteroidetes bacterium]|nr:hypothetical protein [Bacteroidota bacterium]
MRQIYLLLLSLTFCLQLAAQGTQVEFGKSRVQYHRDFDDWSMYETQNYITYWYGDGRNVAQATLQMAEAEFKDIEDLLEHRINDKIEIIVYTDLTDLKQSNIGDEEAFENTGGQTKIFGNKMFVFFNGDHTDLLRQVREGTATVFLNSMLFGSNLQEIVQNSVSLNLPAWFKAGLIDYVGETWSTELDNQLRDIFQTEKYEDFEEFAEENPILAGHSLWYFIGLNYGRATVSNLLYLTRINRNIESGFLYVLGSTFERTTESWQLYFQERFKGDLPTADVPEGEALEVRNRKDLPYTQIKLSPDGKKMAYVTNEIGKYKVFIQDLETGKREKIFKHGYRNKLQATDYNYPILAWSPSGQELAVLYEKRDIIYLERHDLLTGKSEEEELAPQYQRVYSMEYLNTFQLVISAGVKGYSDVFLYYIRTRDSRRLTHDFWDDLDARVVKLDGKPGIIFASNRPDTLLVTEKLDTILPTSNFDLFYMDLDETSNELVRLTWTPFANERNPQLIDSTHFSFLSDASGMYARYNGYIETYLHHIDKVVTMEDGTELIFHPDSLLETKLDSVALAMVDTVFNRPVYKDRGVTWAAKQYDRNILWQHTAPRSKKLVELIWRDDYQQIFIRSNRLQSAITPDESLFKSKEIQYVVRKERAEELKAEREKLEVKPPPAPEPPPVPVIKPEPDTNKVDIDNYFFQSEFDEEELPAPADQEVELEENPEKVILDRAVVSAPSRQQVEEEPDVIRFEPSRIQPHRLTFRTDAVTTQLDNSLLFSGLNSYAGTPQGFGYPPPGILLKGSFKDLFEDYELEGGIRVPTSFNGSEYFLVFDDKKRRLDKRYAVYRQKQRFPLDPRSSTPIQPRLETNTFLTQFEVRYPFNMFASLRGQATLRFDNSTELATDRPSLYDPTQREQRFGLRAEYVFDNTIDLSLNIKQGTRYKVYVEAVKRFEVQVVDGFNFDLADGFMTIIGLDARHYQRFLKHSVLAVRLAGATSFGSEKLLYYLGGVDNWLFPRFNEDIPLPDAPGFAYETVATNMRGFRLNIRNGNSFAVFNSEVRIPIVRYFSKSISNNFLRNFQVVGFFDIGTAWQGKSPFSDENPLNTKFLPDPPVSSNPVSAKVKYFRDPIVLGYGFGVRSVLFGYFIRLDYAWGLETRVVQDPRLYLSLGMDF